MMWRRVPQKPAGFLTNMYWANKTKEADFSTNKDYYDTYKSGYDYR